MADCPCDRDKVVDPWCCAAGECVRESEEVEIITTYIFPPISFRCFDWSAVRDGYEPDDPIGFGATEAEAIADLHNIEDERQ